MTAALFPSEFGEAFVEFDVRFAQMRPSRAVYVRRRLVVALVASAMCLLVGLAAHSALADRGGVPASTPAIRPASSPAAAGAALAVPAAMPAGGQAAQAATATLVAPVTPVALSYVVQPGDTLWSLAQRFHGAHSLSSYVDALVHANGGATVRSGQVLRLP